MNIRFPSAAISETLMDKLPAGILVYEGETGKCVWANHAAAEMLGGNAVALRQQNFKTFISRCRMAEAALDNSLTGHHEVTWRTAAAKIITFDCCLSRFDFEGKQHIVCTLSDITESKQAQKTLERERALLRCLVDSASDLIFIKDQESVYRACNKASEAFIGLPEIEQIGKTDFDFFDREKAEEIRRSDRQVIDEGKPLHYEEWVTGCDGRRLLMDTVKTPYYDPDGKPLGIVGIGRDLTDRKLLEQERLAHLRFFENMDRVNRAIQANNDLERMMSDVLDVVLSVFHCDRAFLLYPCDPQARTCKVPMERTRPDYPGALAMGLEVLTDPQVAETFRILLSSDGPVRFGPGAEFPLPKDIAEQFDFKSKLSMALHPRIGKSWEFGLHQCTDARVWNREEERVFLAIGRRLADGLSTLLAHRDLRRSLEEHEQAQRLAHTGSWAVDFMDNQLVGSNEIFRILEIDPVKFDGALVTFLKNVHPEDREAVNTAHITALKAKTPFAISYRLLFPEGRIKYLHGQCEIVHAGDKPIRLIGTIQDITERALADKALRESERKLGEAARIAHVGYWDRDYVNGTITLSEEACRIFGLAWPCQFSDLNEWHEQWVKLIHPEDQPGAVQAASVALTGGPPYNVNYRVVRPGSDVREVHSYAEVTRDAAGKPLRMFGTMIDITERKRVEERLLASEERLRLTLEATQIGIFDWDVLNDCFFASPEYYTMLGYEPKDGMGDRKEWLERVHPDDRTHVEASIQKVLDREPATDRLPPYTYEARLRHADGTYRWEHVKGFGIKLDAQGRVTRILGIRMDITERKAAEEALHQLNSELDRRVLDRTAQLEAANKELEAFAYSVSHDLRAPLRHIDGFLELLEGEVGATLNEKGRHYMDSISSAALKMGLLIDDLLTFSRMGRHAMSFRQVALQPLVREVIRELESEAAGRDIAWCIGELPKVRGDATMLRMVLVNLISNALKFTQPRKQARIEIGSFPGQGTEVVIYVRDNGVGFDMAYADKLFGVFQRLHHADEFEGIGIGLANVRRIIARHGGRTWGEGEVGRGAKFYFALP